MKKPTNEEKGMGVDEESDLIVKGEFEIALVSSHNQYIHFFHSFLMDSFV